MSDKYCPAGKVDCLGVKFSNEWNEDICSILNLRIKQLNGCPDISKIELPGKHSKEYTKGFAAGRAYQSEKDVEILDNRFNETELRSKDAFINVLKNAALEAAKEEA